MPGGVLSGIGLALMIEAFSAGNGLGLEGAVAINLCGAAALSGVPAMQQLQIPLQGRMLLWGLVMVLAGLSFIELAAA